MLEITDPRCDGFAFFRWASLMTTEGLTYYPGLLMQWVWARDWVDLQLKGSIYK